MSKLLSSAELRDFRKKVARLKKSGLVTGVDARKVKPDTTLKRAIARYPSIAAGDAQAIKVKPGALRAMRSVGYKTAKGRVIFSGDEVLQMKRARATKTKKFTRVDIPIPFKDLKSWFKSARKNADTINKAKRGREYFGFKFGSGSSALYADFDLLLEDLEKYESIGNAHTGVEQKDAFSSITIFRVPNSRAWFDARSAAQKERYNSGRKKSRKLTRRRQRRNMNDDQRRKYNEAAARRMRAYRKRGKNKRSKRKSRK